MDVYGFLEKLTLFLKLLFGTALLGLALSFFGLVIYASLGGLEETTQTCEKGEQP